MSGVHCTECTKHLITIADGWKLYLESQQSPALLRFLDLQSRRGNKGAWLLATNANKMCFLIFNIHRLRASYINEQIFFSPTTIIGMN